jgi:hypothetical protein
VISIPDYPFKKNFYYNPSPKLHEFDEATILFVSSRQELIIKKDSLSSIIFRFYNKLKKALANQLILPPSVTPKKLGSDLNKMLIDIIDVDFSPFWLMSTSHHIQILLYNYNNKIFLEIVPTCPDLFTNKATQIVDKLFKRFMKTYKPYFVAQISHKKAQAWLKQCEEILIAMGYTKEKL